MTRLVNIASAHMMYEKKKIARSRGSGRSTKSSASLSSSVFSLGKPAGLALGEDISRPLLAPVQARER